MKKIMLFMIMLMSIFVVDVYASTGAVAEEGSPNFNTYETEYLKGIQTINVSSSSNIYLYGYSSCQTGSCTYKYANTSPDFKEVLKKAVVCTGGEKYIVYQTGDNAKGYKTDNRENYVGDAYWKEEFQITCTNTQTSGAVELNNPGTQPTTQPSNGSGDYASSGGTTTNEDQGVETYYIILGIVGIITYFLTIVIKKQNLFKKV